MFPGVRRVCFWLAIALKLNAVFVPFCFFLVSFSYCLRYKLLYADRSKTGKTSTYSPSHIPCAKTLGSCPTPKRPVLWVETTEERKGLNTTNQKTSADVQPITKPSTPTVNNQGKYRNLNKTQGRTVPAEPISNPPRAQPLTPFCRSRGGAKEPAGQCRRPMITHKEVN